MANAMTTVAFWQGPTTPAETAYQDSYRQTILPELQLISRTHALRGNAGVHLGSVPRVSQLDAGRLDNELSSMIQEQLAKAFTYLKPGLLSAAQPEAILLVELLIFCGSVWVGRPTPGSALMSLRYVNARASLQHCSDAAKASLAANASLGLDGGRTGVDGPSPSLTQRLGFGALIVGRYLWGRCSSALASRRWAAADDRRIDTTWVIRAQHIMQRTEAAAGLAYLINTLVFLNRGIYSTLRDRILGIRLVLQQASMTRTLSFEYLNRQLVWAELSELLLFILPLLNVSQLRNFLLAKLPRFAGAPSVSSFPSTATGPGADQQGRMPCGICNSPTILRPFVAQPCGHVFCYYCLRANTLADAKYQCVYCHERVTALQDAREAIDVASTNAVTRRL